MDSANGAQYESQGQVRSEAEPVAPGINSKFESSPVRANTVGIISALQASVSLFGIFQGRRAPLRFALAPGFHISRRRRFSISPLAFIFRAVGASRSRPWLLYFAPLALLDLAAGFHISRLRRLVVALA